MSHARSVIKIAQRLELPPASYRETITFRINLSDAAGFTVDRRIPHPLPAHPGYASRDTEI